NGGGPVEPVELGCRGRLHFVPWPTRRANGGCPSVGTAACEPGACCLPILGELGCGCLGFNQQAVVVHHNAGGFCCTQPLVALPLLVPRFGVCEGLHLPSQTGHPLPYG